MIVKNFTAGHWLCIEAARSMQSTITTVQLKTKKPLGGLRRTPRFPLVYLLGLSAENSWQKQKRFRQLVDVIRGVKFIYGIIEKTSKHQGRAVLY